MKVRAAVLSAPGAPFDVRTVDLAPPGPGEVRVRMEASGVCASDWHLVSGATPHPVPLIAGHEGAGVVEEVGPGVTRVEVGQRVSLSWAPDCGACFQCARAKPGLCETNVAWIWAGGLSDGTTRFSDAAGPIHHYSALSCFAEQTVVSETSCVPGPAEVPATVAAIVGCAVTTGFCAATQTGRLEAGEQVLVYGAGGVGLSAVMGAKDAGAAAILAVDRTRERAERAQAFGATHALVDGPDLVEAVRELTDGRGVDLAIDTTGRPALQERCLAAVRPGGRAVLVGLGGPDDLMTVCGADLIRTEKQVLGSYYGSANPPQDFPRIVERYLAGALPLEQLVTQTYHLDQINDAFADLNAGRLLRGVIVF